MDLRNETEIFTKCFHVLACRPPQGSEGPTIFELYHRDSKPGVEILDDYIIEDELNHPIVNPNYNFTNCLANCNFDSNLTPSFRLF